MMSKSMQVPGASAMKNLCIFLLAITLTDFSTGGQPTLCQSESILLLKTIIQSLGNSSDATLYTPEDSTACYADNLSCFSEELQVIQKEHDDHAGIVSRLQNHLERLTVRRSHTAPSTKCPPCEAHQLHPVPVFLNRLLELLQRTCRMQSSQELVRSPPPKPRGRASQTVSRGSPGSHGNQPGELRNSHKKPATLYNV